MISVRRIAERLLVALLLLTPLQECTLAQSALKTGAAQPASSAWMFHGFPDSDLYPPYTADPLRAQSAIVFAGVLDSEIPESGNSRFILRLGGNFALFRIHPAGDPDRGLQLDFKGGFFGHFDSDHSLDNIGWDGIYGLTMAWRPTAAFAFRIGTLHDSAHVGDEYAERTGRTRIGYTREEWVAGASWTPSHRFLTYAEVGWGYGLEEFQSPLRLQLGFEVLGRHRFVNDRLRWYFAIDLGAYEERDWDTRLTSQTGITITAGPGTRRYRLAIEYVDGRAALGELSPYHESTLGLGFYYDF